MKDEPFEKLFGNTVELKLLDFPMSVPQEDFTISELECVTGVSKTSVDKVIKKFKEWGITMEVTRRGSMTMYSLNENSPIVKAAYGLNGAIMAKMYPDLTNYPSSRLAGPLVQHDLPPSEHGLDVLSPDSIEQPPVAELELGLRKKRLV